MNELNKLVFSEYLYIQASLQQQKHFHWNIFYGLDTHREGTHLDNRGN